MLVPGDVCLVDPVADAATDDVAVGTAFVGTLLLAAVLGVGGLYKGLLCLAYDRINVAAEGVLATGRSIDVCAAGRSDLVAALDSILMCSNLSNYERFSDFIAP